MARAGRAMWPCNGALGRGRCEVVFHVEHERVGVAQTNVQTAGGRGGQEARTEDRGSRGGKPRGNEIAWRDGASEVADLTSVRSGCWPITGLALRMERVPVGLVALIGTSTAVARWSWRPRGTRARWGIGRWPPDGREAAAGRSANGHRRGAAASPKERDGAVEPARPRWPT
jgi:hypothetical protein